MSGLSILKNVFNFAQILNLATSKNLNKWDESTLRKAVNWAQYCEEVHKHVQEQGCGKDINTKILQLTVLLTPASFLQLSFDSLESATKLLILTILTNPHGQPDLKNSLETSVDPNLWSEVTGKIKERTASGVTDLDEIFSIIWIQNSVVNQLSEDHNDSNYAQLFLSNLFDIMRTSENQQRFKHYLESLCDRLMSLENGWELLVKVFSSNPESNSEARKKMILDVLLSRMTLTAQNIAKSPLLEVDLNYLTEASLYSADFLKVYLSSLEKWSRCFQPCMDGTANEFWRDSYGNGASLLAGHFSSLLMHPSKNSGSETSLKSTTLSFISGNIKNSDFTVWRTVAHSLLHQ